MKKNTPYIITLSRLAILLLCSSLLVGCTGALPNAYSKAREKTQKILAHNGFKGKVQVKNIKKVILDSAGIYVDYTYSEETYCLLYTSPSPRDGATSRMPSSA